MTFSFKELEKLERFLDRSKRLKHYNAIPSFWVKPESENTFIIESYTYSDKVCGDIVDILRPIYFINYNGDKINFNTHIRPLLLKSKNITKHEINEITSMIEDWKSSVYLKDLLVSKSIKIKNDITLKLKINGTEIATEQLNVSLLKSNYQYADLYFNSNRWHANTPKWDKLPFFEKELAKRQMLQFLSEGKNITLILREKILKALGRKDTFIEKPNYGISKNDPIPVIESGDHFSYTTSIPLKIFEVNQWITSTPVVNSTKSKTIVFSADIKMNNKSYKDVIVIVTAGRIKRAKNGELWIRLKSHHMITIFDPKTLKDGRYLDMTALQ